MYRLKILTVAFILFTFYANGQSSDSVRVIDMNKEAFSLYGVDAFEMEKQGHQALVVAHRISFEEGVAMSYNTIALARLSRGEYQEAAESFVKALEIYEKRNDTQSASDILSNMGVVYYYLEDHKRSLSYHKRALKSRIQANDSSGIAKSYNNIGIAYKNLGDNSLALSYYKKALNYKIGQGDTLGMSSTLNNIGNIYLDSGRFRQARQFFSRSYKIDESQNSQMGMAVSLINIGVTYTKTKDYFKAEKQLLQGIDLAREADAKSAREQGYKRLAELYEVSGKYQKALKWQKKWADLRDTLINTEKNRSINELEARHNNNRIRNENELLKQKQVLQEEQLTLQNTLIVSAIIVTILLVVLGVLAFRSYGLKRKSLNMEIKKNKEILFKNDQISKQKQQLEEMNEAKNRMFSILSHDMRAPMARLQSILELVSAGYLSDEEVQPMLKNMASETNTVNDLLTNILEWVKSQMDGLSISPDPVRLYDTSQEIINIYAPFAKEKGIYISNEIDENSIVSADENILKLIFRNLLANAIKFTSEGSITLRSKVVLGMVHITISDTGIGMSDDDVKKLFSPQQFSKDGTDNEKGTGLGLLLVKEFIMKLNGTIHVKSVPGEGASFIFTLPLE